MTEAKTLMQLSGADTSPPAMAEAALLVIDMQNEYLSGPLALPDARAAIDRAAGLLSLAREAGAPVIHVAHKGAAGSLFDRDGTRGAIVDAMGPEGDEPVVEKGLPNAFAGTALTEVLGATGRKELVIVGFMSHMCVSATARAALDLGFRATVDAQACATRNLPDGTGGVIDARALHKVALVELSDRFANIAWDHDWR
ncbi:MAG: cysteine hydrolase family protein [Pseudomonadota bacterium]